VTLRLNYLAILLILGWTTAPALRAQAQSDLRFEVASVRRVEIPNVNGGVPVFPVAGGVGTFPAGRPVVDETGLAGRYDFKIHYEYLVRRSGTDGVASTPAPSIFTALDEQLGLKLEPTTSPFPHLTIDSIEREPGDN
jgi:hypothetical protein